MEKNEENSIVVKESDLIRPDYNWTYPIYHRGLYLEQYFYHFFLENRDIFGKLNREYLPIFFTNIYHLHNFNGIDQKRIDFMNADTLLGLKPRSFLSPSM